MSLRNESCSCATSDCCTAFWVCGNTALARTGAKKQEAASDGREVLHPISLKDRVWMAPLLKEEDSMASMGCFGTMYLWGTAFGQQVARLGNRILACYREENKISFAFPFGKGPLTPAIQQMRREAERCGCALTINGMTESQMQQLTAEYPTQFVITDNRDNADYVYEVEKLANLKGKKLQNKRNHCNRFEKEHADWKFEPMEPRHFEDCRALLREWEANHEDGDEMQDAERLVIEQSFANFETLGLEGGVLYADGKLVAFTLGELVGQHSFDTRLEKAEASVNGAYQMINREFARMLMERHPDLKYVNREEDMGHENLRKAKLSYHPDVLLMKYSARWIG